MSYRIVLFIVALLLGATARAQTPEELIAANKAAMGGDAWDAVRSVRAEGTLELSGLTGEVVSLTDVAGQRFRTEVRVGPLEQVQVFDGERNLIQENGQVRSDDAEASVRAAHSELYRAVNGIWYPDRWPAQIAPLPDATEDGVHYRRLSVTPRAGETYEVWFDPQTHRVDRTIERRGHVEIANRFTAYATVDGLLLPATIIVSTRGGDAPQVLKLDHFVVDPGVSDEDFELASTPADDYRIVDGADTVTVPFELRNNHTYIEVFINGEGPFSFLADTGGRHLVTPQVAAAVGLKTEGEFEIGGAGARRRVASFTQVETLRLANLELHDQAFVVLDMSELSEVGGARIDGLIGYEVFRRFLVEYDYATGEIRLHRPGTFSHDGSGHRVPFRFSDSTPLVRGSIDGHEGDIAIDTGSRSHLSLTTPFAREHGYFERHADAPQTIIGWGVGGPTIGHVARAQTLTIGETLTIEAPLIDFSRNAGGALSNPDEIANLGAGIMRQFKLILDYEQQVITFVPNERFGQREAQERSGMFLRAVDGGWSVVHVTPGGPAELAGLQPGDVLTRVDDRPVQELSLPAVREDWRRNPAGTRVALRLVRAGRQLDAQLDLADLVP